MYRENAQAALARALQKETLCLLAIETSCDETAAAVTETTLAVEPERPARQTVVLGAAISTQIETHVVYGGVVPEIASRMHIENIEIVVRRALEKAERSFEQLDAVAVTYGPGLVGALLVGVSYAKGLALSLGVPLVPVHHIEGHLYANYLAHAQLAAPFLCLIVSGGHTHLVRVEADGRYTLLGRTRDDAAGEVFDKVARVLGLGYPGGPKIDAIAETGDPTAFAFPRAVREGLDFSFSGLKTAVVNLVHGMRQRNETIPVADIAASFRRAVVDVLVEKTLRAAEETGIRSVAIAGGVSANALLRSELQARAQDRGIRAWLPPLALCTDNAEMIACAGVARLLRGEIADMTLNAVPTLPLAVDRN